jgi:hypothetical protein
MRPMHTLSIVAFQLAECLVQGEKIGRPLFVCDHSLLEFDAPQLVPMLDGCLAAGDSQRFAVALIAYDVDRHVDVVPSRTDDL